MSGHFEEGVKILKESLTEGNPFENDFYALLEKIEAGIYSATQQTD